MSRINLDVDVDIGANASEEEADEGVDAAGSVQAIDVVHYQQLQESPMDKKGFQGCLKLYMKGILGKMKEEGKDDGDFKNSAMGLMKYISSGFDDWVFYADSSMDVSNGIFPLKWEDGGETPTFYFFVDGLDAEKV